MHRRRFCLNTAPLLLLACLATAPLLAQCDNNPIAVDDEVLLAATPVLIDVLANDQEPDGEALRLTVLSTTCPLAFEVLFDVVRLTPTPAVRTACTVTYRIEDESQNFATATINVTPNGPLFADGFETGNSSQWTETCASASC